MANITITMDNNSRLTIEGQPFVVEGENITTSLTLVVPATYQNWEKQVHFKMQDEIAVTDGVTESTSDTYAIIYTEAYELPQQLIDAQITQVQVVLVSGMMIRPSEVRNFPYYKRSIAADPQATAIPTNAPPSSASDTGTAGSIRYSADYIYVCIATNTWKRCPLGTW